MIRKDDRRLVSLEEICEERMLVEKNGAYIAKPAYFASMNAMLCGALNFVEFFEKMHLMGKVYASISPDPFYFDLETGDFFYLENESFYDKDTVASYVTEGSFRDECSMHPDWNEMAVTEFAAPELLEESEEPERWQMETDWYFMSVYLFEYFFHTGSPFEGKQMVNRCFLSPMEKEIFRARQGCFCMDADHHENPPVKGIHDKLIRYWKEYPDILHKIFRRAFYERAAMATLRPTEVDWKQVLVQLIMDYKVCRCGHHGFSFKLKPGGNGTLSCPKCGKVYYVLTDGMSRILLAEGEKLYECQTGRHPFDKDTVTGLVVENRQHKGLYGIKNVSKGEWRGFYPNGETKDIAPGQGIPIWEGMTLRFELGENWNLRLLHPTVEEPIDETGNGKGELDEQTD